MPGVSASLRAAKPEAIYQNRATLGAYLRKRRRELGHRQLDAAQEIGANPTSFMWWERDEREPSDHWWPSIIAYLGHEPWPVPTTTGERLLAERRRRGLAICQAAAVMGVDETTFWWWESGKRTPRYPRTKALVAAFLSGQS